MRNKGQIVLVLQYGIQKNDSLTYNQLTNLIICGVKNIIGIRLHFFKLNTMLSVIAIASYDLFNFILHIYAFISIELYQKYKKITCDKCILYIC